MLNYLRKLSLERCRVVLFGLLTCLAGATAYAVDYRRDVEPILATYCAGCHNRVDREGELSLQTLADLRAGGDNGAVLVPGDSAASRLIQVSVGRGGSEHAAGRRAATWRPTDCYPPALD